MFISNMDNDTKENMKKAVEKFDNYYISDASNDYCDYGIYMKCKEDTGKFWDYYNKLNKESKMKTDEYPCYKKSGIDSIVKFTEKKTGTIVYKGRSDYDVGTYFEDWAEEESFTKLTPEEHYEYIIKELKLHDRFSYANVNDDVINTYKITQISIDDNMVDIVTINETLGITSYFKFYDQNTNNSTRLIKLEETMEKTETIYKAVKRISGQVIIENNACDGEREKFVKHFGYGVPIDWNKENEDWIIDNISGGIQFGLDKGLIEKIEPDFDENKFYYIYQDDTIFFLTKVDDKKWNFSCLDNNRNLWSTETWDSKKEALENLSAYNLKFLKSFDSTKEAMKHFFSIEEELTKTEKINLMYDLMQELNFKIGDELVTDCTDNFGEDKVDLGFSCTDVNCSECKFGPDSDGSE